METVNNSIKELLFFHNPQVESLAQFIHKECLNFISVFFLAGLILEFFGFWDFKGVLGRTILAVLVLVSFESFLKTGVNTSFDISYSVLKKFSPHNKYIEKIQRAKREVQNNTKAKKKIKPSWDLSKILAPFFISSSLSILMGILNYFSFILLGQIYTLIYHLLFCLFGVSALLSILNLTKSSLKGSILTLMWLYLTPLIVAIILVLIDGLEEFQFLHDGSIKNTLRHSLQFLLANVFLLLSPVLASAIILGSGLHTVGNQLSQMGALSSILTFKKVAVDLTKGFSLKGIYTAKKLTSPLIKNTKGHLHEKANELRKENNLNPTPFELKNENRKLNLSSHPKENLKTLKQNIQNKAKRLKRSFKETPLKNKALILSDNLLNRKKNSYLRKNRLKSIQTTALNPYFNEPSPLTPNKNNTRKHPFRRNRNQAPLILEKRPLPPVKKPDSKLLKDKE